jgi:hypothetical protein
MARRAAGGRALSPALKNFPPELQPVLCDRVFNLEATERFATTFRTHR